MEFALTKEQEQFAREFQEYLRDNLATHFLEGTGGLAESPAGREFVRKMGHDGWQGIGWPEEYGGHGRSPMDQHIFNEVASYERAPLTQLGLNTVGPTIMRSGSEEQKKKFLPSILSGDIEIAVGYTEPEAGTDLASLKTSAVKDGDYYIINGQKVFTSLAHQADYIWLAARTDPQAPKHRGISLFMVDVTLPGVSIKPLYTLGGLRTNYTFYDDVRVPEDALIGEENKGWRYITTQLDFERVSLLSSGSMRRNVEEAMEWAKETKIDGKPVIKEPWVRTKFAEMMVDLEALKLFNYHVTWLVTNGMPSHAESSVVKAFGSELNMRILGTLMQIMDNYGQLQAGSKWAPLRGRIEGGFRNGLILIFGGGAAEIQRTIISMAGLGMPRSF